MPLYSARRVSAANYGSSTLHFRRWWRHLGAHFEDISAWFAKKKMGGGGSGDNLELIRLQGRGGGGGGGGGGGMVGAAAHNKTFKTEWDLVSKRTVSIETVAMTGRKSHLIRNKKNINSHAQNSTCGHDGRAPRKNRGSQPIPGRRGGARIGVMKRDEMRGGVGGARGGNN